MGIQILLHILALTRILLFPLRKSHIQYLVFKDNLLLRQHMLSPARALRGLLLLKVFDSAWKASSSLMRQGPAVETELLGAP